MILARLAIVLHEGTAGPREVCLGAILDFFGVPWQAMETSKFMDFDGRGLEYAVFGSIQAIGAALKQGDGSSLRSSRPVACYAYMDDDRGLCGRALQSVLGNASVSLEDAPEGDVSLKVCNEPAEIAGAMAGIKLSLRLKKDDYVLAGIPVGEQADITTLVSAADSPVFLRFECKSTSVFVCTSSHIVDIDQPVGRGFYDVKEHFCSAVALVTFIRFIFSEVAWRPQELGACLIIDDPLLKDQYGFCSFVKLRELMKGHGFTTNIAFIPWNWRRTSPDAGKFFGKEQALFSVSIHGCDHTAREFGATSRDVLQTRAQLARSRMQKHEARTGIVHDSIMVFPQGVFSSPCPDVLQRSGFLAAVNTEIVPVDSSNARTRIRDVWDVAIMSYGDFPIFTRRYAFHGLENFAFDLLLGKPCLIVVHHEAFKDGGSALIELIGKIGSLNCRLRWRALGQVIRRACRHRTNGTSTEDFEMYGNELLIDNSKDRAIESRIRKRSSQDDLVFEIMCDGRPIVWTTENEHLVFGAQISPHTEKCFRVIYREQADTVKAKRSLRFELGVAARRILSEFRDDYVSRSPLLSVPAARLRSAFRKAI